MAKTLKGKRVIASKVVIPLEGTRLYAKQMNLHLLRYYPLRINVASFYDKEKCRFNYHMIYGGYIHNLDYLAENQFHRGITSKYTVSALPNAMYYRVMKLFNHFILFF